jgi:hypothetical protein
MLILNVPKQFQPNYKSNYPEYSNGLNMEEVFYKFFLNNRNKIKTDLIYLPIFWTSYYIINDYGKNILPLLQYLKTLDLSRKYFTIVQFASGIYITNDINLNIKVFSAGGGGLNKILLEKSLIIDKSTGPIKMFTTNKQTVKINKICEKSDHGKIIFNGKKGDVDIPLICLPSFPFLNITKDIFCSFMGRYDTHSCRLKMWESLKSIQNFKFFNSVNFNQYCNIINRSIFTLAPRGYGYTSFRIYEAILGESIPIYIWEDKKVLPFNDEINYEDFCIIIHSSEVNKLPSLLKNINIDEKRENLKKIKYKFTIEGMVDYIVKKL